MGPVQTTIGTNMNLALAPLVAALLVAPACMAESVIKCTSESGVTYQTTPCTDGATKVVLLQPLARADLHSDVEVAAALPARMPLQGQSDAKSSRDELQVGITDLQVLNNRRWGKPQRITRNREARAWHERWTYNTGANGGKQLHFVNGKLTAVADLEPSLPPVNSASVLMFEER